MPTKPPPATAPPKDDTDSGWPEEAPADSDAFDRVTVAPPMPPEEYVAAMMASGPPTERGSVERRGPPPRGGWPRAVDPTDLDEPRSTQRAPALPVPDEALPSNRPALLLDLTTESVMPPAVTALSAPKGELSLYELSLPSATGDALDLVSSHSARVSSAPSDPMRAIRDHFDVGDFSGALVLAEAMLEGSPAHPEAQSYAEKCRDVLRKMYLSRLGGARRIPKLVVASEQVRWLSLDHRTGFLLSLCDGSVTIDDVLDMSGMPQLEALRLLFELHQQSVIQVT